MTRGRVAAASQFPNHAKSDPNRSARCLNEFDDLPSRAFVVPNMRGIFGGSETHRIDCPESRASPIYSERMSIFAGVGHDASPAPGLRIHLAI